MLHFRRHLGTSEDEIAIVPRELVIAGWTGRDGAAISHHIEELAGIGVPRPSTVPLFYRGSASLLTQSETLQVVGAETSGEVEAVLVALADGLWVTVGSDHTDRKSESWSVAHSKQLCGKVVARELWRYDEVRPRWDQLILRAEATIGGLEEPYQEGPLASIRAPDDLMRRYRSGEATLAPGTVMFCGTVPARGGVRPATRFAFSLHDPELNRTIAHAYDVVTLPIVS